MGQLWPQIKLGHPVPIIGQYRKYRAWLLRTGNNRPECPGGGYPWPLCRPLAAILAAWSLLSAGGPPGGRGFRDPLGGKHYRSPEKFLARDSGLVYDLRNSQNAQAI